MATIVYYRERETKELLQKLYKIIRCTGTHRKISSRNSVIVFYLRSIRIINMRKIKIK
jgi:hypothetical protein